MTAPKPKPDTPPPTTTWRCIACGATAGNFAHRPNCAACGEWRLVTKAAQHA
jgi:hypothetical protein